ncbi:MAG: hypothetical protein GC161_10420 [Planctomycetaceae bacterium]|nr:hypothetical protein [Planctomycetaceae bacterium]
MNLSRFRPSRPGFRFAAAALLLGPTAAAQLPQSDRAPLLLGPLVSGQDLILDWRSGAPNTTAFLLLGFSGAPTVLPGFQLPALGVAPASAFVPVATDGAGRVRLELPTVFGLFPAGTGLELFAQFVAVAPNGSFVVSNAAASAVQPDPLPSGSLVADAAALPAGADGFAGALVRAADFSGDGYPDVVLSNGTDVVYWVNDGTGAFVDATANLPHPGDAVFALAVADVDGDGDFDLVTGGGFDSANSVPNRLWRNDGAGHFQQDLAFPAGEGQASDFGFGDFDGDGDLDLVIVNGPEGHLAEMGGLDRLYRNDGTGAFSEYAGFLGDAWNVDTDRSTAVAVGDLDNDGDLDLFIAKNGLGSNGVPNVLLLNVGDGVFVDVTANFQASAFADRTAHAVFADLDLDGDLDIVAANSVMTTPTSQSNDVWINQGGIQGGVTGFFADDAASFLEPLHGAGIRLKVRVADVDVDGDLDVLLCTHDFFPPAPQLLFLNQGGRQGGTLGAFERDLSFQPGNFIAGDGVLFDADLDGDAEVMLPASGVLGGDPASQFAVRYLRNLAL